MSLPGSDHLLSAVLLAISSNVDNFGVGFAYGLGKRGIGIGPNLLIALVSGAGTLVSMAAGEWVNDFMSEEFANVLGGSIMIALGLHACARAVLRSSRTAPPIAGTKTSVREALVLAFSLSLNNLGGGLGAGISHVRIVPTAALTTAVSVAAVSFGHLLGSRMWLSISRRGLGITAGLIFVFVGVYELYI